MKLAKYKAELFVWMKANPGMLFKVGGKKLSSNRHHDATHYDRKYFDTDSAYIFSGNLIDSRQQASRVARAYVDSVCLLLGTRRQ